MRASYFQENWGAALGALAQGIVPTFVPKTFASRRSRPRTSVALSPRRSSKVHRAGRRVTIELAGPRDYTGEDVAAALAEITGKPVIAQEAPLDAVVPTFTSFGMSTAVATLYREMYAGIMSGRVAPESGNRNVRGAVGIKDTLAALLGAK